MRILLIALLLCLISLLSGCDSGPKLVPASGTVKFKDGRVVPSGIIELIPETEKGLNARAQIRIDGRFELSSDRRKGAVAGKYKVVVIQVVLADGASSHAGSHNAPLVVNTKYAKPESSDLTLEIPESGSSDLLVTVDAGAAAKKGW